MSLKGISLSYRRKAQLRRKGIRGEGRGCGRENKRVGVGVGKGKPESIILGYIL